jgi:class 3 adenylate cyclase
MKSRPDIFKPAVSKPFKSISLLFDMENFTGLFSHPDIHDTISKYLNLIIDAVSLTFEGGELYWDRNEKGDAVIADALPRPIHTKFLGDGVLYIWRLDDFTQKQIIDLVDRVWSLKNSFSVICAKASLLLPVNSFPKRIRFGIASGTVYRLTYQNESAEEYIGYSINLASRLQSYSRDIGFIVSGRLNIPDKTILKHGYKKCIAKKIHGFSDEIVIIDTHDYNNLDEKVRLELFDELGKPDP